MEIFFSKPGVLCCAGNDCESLWKSVVDGNQTGITKVTALNGKEYYKGKIDDSLLINKSSARYDMRIMRIEETCLLQIEDTIALCKEKYGDEKIGVCVGSCDNGTEFSLKGHKAYFETGKFEDDYSLEIQSADYVSTFISEKYSLKGPSLAFSTACSSSAGAIIKASELIRAGICDAVVVGGVDIASNTVLMGFDSLEAVSNEITNPLSKNRHGITLAEAAAFFVMSKDKLDDNGVKLLGYGESADAYHATSPDPSGDGAYRAMKNALENACLSADKIDYLNMHGTGTKYNDSMEAKAIDKVFGEYKIPVSTTKAITGHTLGAAGALEAAICWLTIVKNKEQSSDSSSCCFPAQIWDEVQDEEIPVLRVISNMNNRFSLSDVASPRICMSNSFAFGGANSSLILGL